jgi:hypothetical protein
VNCNHFTRWIKTKGANGTTVNTEQTIVSGELWGSVEGDYTFIYKSVFDQLCDKGNISPKGFLSWANSHDLIQRTPPHNTKLKRIGDNAPQRCVCLKTADSEAFMDADEYGLEDLPFD